MINIIGDTDVGKVRTNNQDAFDFAVKEESIAWVLVCDGMGGEKAGDVASKTAVDTIREIVDKQLTADMQPNTIKNLMQSAIITANAKVYELSKTNAAFDGMGTTVLLAVITQDHVYTAHAGDSRAYLMENFKIINATKDHTVVQMMVDKGQLSFEEAKQHPKRHYITRALGVADMLDIEHNEYAWNKNSTALFCTDGLYSHVQEAQLEILTQQAVEQENPTLFINAANDNGGKDNITAVLVYNK